MSTFAGGATALTDALLTVILASLAPTELPVITGIAGAGANEGVADIIVTVSVCLEGAACMVLVAVLAGEWVDLQVLKCSAFFS